MEVKELEDTIKKVYNHRFKSIEKRVDRAIDDSKIEVEKLSADELKAVTSVIIEEETKSLKSDIEDLLAQKEAIERSLEKKSEKLQETKYEIFNVLEEKLKTDNKTLTTLHQIKLQSIDLYDILSEMVESAIITALEKDQESDELHDTIKELVKEITYESIKEGSLNTIRVRKILSTILATAIDIADATPTKADDILRPTLKGMRSGLVKSIDRFKQRLAFMPVEAKHILIEDYDTIIEDLNQTDTLFSQIIITQASESSSVLRKVLLDIQKDMRYDLEELVLLSKETADIIRERFSNFAKVAVKKADSALHSSKAQEAKRMGVQAWEVARDALGTALKSAKEAIDKKEK
jgi:DNA-binding transcriptional regulator GbsR (MarR family)